MARSVAGMSVLFALSIGQAQDKGETTSAHRPESAPSTPEIVSGDYAARYASACASCHGADGRSDTDATPVLAGQHSFYAITQLFLFREGRRANDEMTAVAKTLTNDDMQGFASFIATLPPVLPPVSEPVDADRMARGSELSRQYKCSFCHGADYSGGEQVPRIGGQHEHYLRTTLREFKNGERQGYTMAMAGALSQISQDDLDTVAYYLARFRD